MPYSAVTDLPEEEGTAIIIGHLACCRGPFIWAVDTLCVTLSPYELEEVQLAILAETGDVADCTEVVDAVDCP
jgi:hypothetical protein